MSLIAKKVSPRQLRFHVQQLATEALQEIRIKHRWEAIDAENEALEIAKNLSSILKQSDLSWIIGFVFDGWFFRKEAVGY